MLAFVLMLLELVSVCVVKISLCAARSEFELVFELGLVLRCAARWGLRSSAPAAAYVVARMRSHTLSLLDQQQ